MTTQYKLNGFAFSSCGLSLAAAWHRQLKVVEFHHELCNAALKRSGLSNLPEMLISSESTTKSSSTAPISTPSALLDELAPPQLVTCDGDSGGLKALHRLWPNTPVQRCIVHVKRNIQRATGLHPTSPMGKALQRLSFELLAADNLDKAAKWTVKLHQFGTVFSSQSQDLRQRRALRADSEIQTRQQKMVVHPRCSPRNLPTTKENEPTRTPLCLPHPS